MPNKVIEFQEEKLLAAGKTPGWNLGADGHLIGNSKLGSHVARVMWVNEKDEPLYDQIVRIERGGAVFLPVDARNRIGLQKNWRPQTRDQEKFAKEYPRVDWSEVGRESWELLGGFSNAEESALKTAARETQEESGSQVVSIEDLGPICDNRAFSVHLGRMTWGRIDPTKKPADRPDPYEKKLSAVRFFTLAELRSLLEEDKLYDSFTLSALGALFLRHPELVAARS
ncbi:NUDIX domain-containing protein [Candidatus Uhrbacteria bacterium]|nr:NUDIX domain-containing protein [Candidatus Uhrbacteria bacterium]